MRESPTTPYPTISIYASPQMLSTPLAERRKLITRIEQSGIEHVFVGDHISFHNGFGMDGLVDAATLAAMSDSLSVMVGVYLLALRHPVAVARQLSSLSRSAPGRIVMGIGIGGEDRHEMAISGVDAARRGKLTNHALAAVKGLLTGEPHSYQCEFFEYEDAIIKPAPDPAIPFMVGGRSDAAIRRTALQGDGWLGLWCSPSRFGQVNQQVADVAAESGRGHVAFEHGLQVWVGFGEKQQARQHVARQMNEMYQMPFEPFEKYSPYGSPREVADFLAPYVEQGCGRFNIAACGESFEHEIDGVAEVWSLLAR